MWQNERRNQFRAVGAGPVSAGRNTCGWPRFGLPAVLKLRPLQPETASVLRFLGAAGTSAELAGSAANAGLVSAAAEMAEQVAQQAAPRAVRLFLSGADFERCAGLPVQQVWPAAGSGVEAPPGQDEPVCIRDHPAPPDAVVLYALTLGAPLDAWLRACQAASLQKAVVADAAANALLFELEQTVRQRILAEIQPFGLAMSRPVFPGDGVLPLSVQPMICRWLDTHRKMAMGVRPDLQVMEPSKSLTAAASLDRPACTGTPESLRDAPLPGHDCRRCVMAASCLYADVRPATVTETLPDDAPDAVAGVVPRGPAVPDSDSGPLTHSVL